MNSRAKTLQLRCCWLIPALILLVGSTSRARKLTLEEVIDVAVYRSSRGEIIRGDLEVSRQTYRARRLNFLFPEVSINGAIPSYEVRERFDFFAGNDTKQFFRRTDLGFSSDITLKQNLLTGGELTFTANLVSTESEYPNFRENITTMETDRSGLFVLTYKQPLLKASEAKYELSNKKDDLSLAELTFSDELQELTVEVTDAFFGQLQWTLKNELTEDNLQAARLQASIDSAKFSDGVLSEEQWLESASARLDAELEAFDIENQLAEKNRNLALLLEVDNLEYVELEIPAVAEHIDDQRKQAYINNWKESKAIKKAALEYEKASRTADYASSAHGLTGSLDMSYRAGRGAVKVDGLRDDNNTDSWQVGLNVSYPLWDGGASSAAVKAGELGEKKAQIVLEKAQKSARWEIIDLVNRLDVSYRKLDLLEKQIELAGNKLDIANSRLGEGQISRLTLLEARVFYLEAQDKYLAELKNYLNSKTELESKYSN